MKISIVIPTTYLNLPMVAENIGLLRKAEGEYNFVVSLSDGAKYTGGLPSSNGKVLEIIESDERVSSVAAMATGGREALDVYNPDLLMFLHDDVEVLSENWPSEIAKVFEAVPRCGLAGFGGAKALAIDDIYKIPYQLQQLARSGYRSNDVNWKTHGDLAVEPERVAVLDAFCQIFRREAYEEMGGFEDIAALGIEHHCNDLAAACRMAELNWETWVIPTRVHHLGGMTSTTGSYDDWLKSRGIAGDAEVHRESHRIFYERFRNVLPLRVKP